VVDFKLFIEAAKVVLPAPFPISVEVPEVPAIACSANPDRDGTPVQTAMIGELIDRETIWVLATLAVILPSIHHLTRASSATFYNGLLVVVVPEKPADSIVELQLAFPSGHLWSPVSIVWCASLAKILRRI